MTTPSTDTFTDQLAAAVREARKARGWTQQTLADLAGVSQGSLSYFEKRGQGLHIEKVVAVLAVLGYRLALEEIDPIAGNNTPNTMLIIDEPLPAEETIYPNVEAAGAEQVQP